ncbi:FAD:protein FMN transferase [Desulfogranum japonicum]|uniref:FAD:protein FMN transferase n=1 Tax=Desulfogranum japonicum TaxID=231447 RepID=UPI00041ED48E|nr:FAD:protein FMN transferase [Desulfogranum japonicum]
MEKPISQRVRYTRRTFLQIAAVAGTAGAVCGWTFIPHDARAHVVREVRTLMGTQISLIVCGPDRDACYNGIEKTLDRMEQIEGFLSRFMDGSDLSRLNSSGVIDHPGMDLREVLSLAADISGLTEGAFDVTVLPLLQLYQSKQPVNTSAFQKALELVGYHRVVSSSEQIRFSKPGMGITLDGIGKGYIVDQGVATLQAAGFSNIYVEAGGDLMVSGQKPGRRPWRIGVRNPRPEHPGKMVAIETNRSLAVATSGDYMQYFSKDMRHHHILDPRTGISPPELASATVTAPSVAKADALATAAMVMGPERSMDILASLPDCEALLIGKDLRQYRTTGFQA